MVRSIPFERRWGGGLLSLLVCGVMLKNSDIRSKACTVWYHAYIHSSIFDGNILLLLLPAICSEKYRKLATPYGNTVILF